MSGSWGQAEFVGEDAGKGASGHPVRPCPTPLFAFAMALWGSTGVSVSLLPAVGSKEIAVWCSLSGLFALAVSSSLLLRRRGVFPSLLAVALLCGAFLGGAHELSLREGARTAGAFAGERAEFQAVSDGTVSDFGGSVIAAMESPSGGSVRVRVLFDDGRRPMCGERFSARCRSVDSGMQEVGWLWEQGVVADVKTEEFEALPSSGVHGAILDVRRRASALLDGWDCAGAFLLKAILVSDREDFESAVVAGGEDGADVGAYDAVKVLGLAHLVAVSGSHLVLVAGLIDCALSALAVSRKGRVCVSALFILAYLVFAGMPVSAMRAAVMSFVALASSLVGRRSSSLSSLGACVLALVVMDPSVAISLSFQLSALATLGIVLFSGLAQAWIRLLASSFPNSARESVALTLSSSVLAQPLSSAVFGQLPVSAFVANVLAAPWFAVLCGGGLVALCAALAFEPLGALLVPFVWAAQAFCELCVVLSKAPWAAVPFSGSAPACLLASALAGGVLWFVWPCPSERGRSVLKAGMASFCAVVLAIAFLAPRFVPDRIVCLDVGQGDAILLQSKGVNVLVDTGRSDTSLLSGLADFGVTSLDAVVVTHSDDDHCGSLDALRGVVGVERVVVAEGALECPCEKCRDLLSDARALCGERVVGVAKGDVLSCGSFSVDVISPVSYEDEGGNADSLVFLASHESRLGIATALLCGDAEAEQLEALFEEGSLGHVDVFKVGHHGSKAAVTEEQARALSPEVALLSVGAENAYGHPNPDVVRTLSEVGSAVFRTDEDGAVSCEFSDAGLTVRCENP